MTQVVAPPPQDRSSPGLAARARRPLLSLSARRWLLGLLGAALVLQFVGLSQQSLWLDELFSVWASDAETMQQVIERLRPDVHPPLYQLVLWAWMQVWGDSEFTVRALSALMGVAAVGVFFFGSRRLYGRDVAWLGTVLFATCYTLVLYGRTARAYEMLVLLSTVFTFAWLGLVARLLAPAAKHARGGWEQAVLFLCSAVLACATHFYGALLAGTGGLYLLLLSTRPEARGLRASTWALVMLTGLLCLIVVAGWLSQSVGLRGKAGHFWIQRPNFIFAVKLGRIFAGTLGSGLVIYALLGWALWKVLPQLRPGAIHAAGFETGALRACFFLGMTSLAIAVISSYAVPTVTARNMIILLPAFWLFFVFVIGNALEPRVAARCLVAIAALSLVASVSRLALSAWVPRLAENEQPRGAVEFVDARLAREPRLSLLVNNPGGDGYLYWDYYLRRSALPSDPQVFRWDPAALEAAAQAALARGESVGILIGFLRDPEQNRFLPLKAAFDHAGCELWEGRFTFALACRPR